MFTRQRYSPLALIHLNLKSLYNIYSNRHGRGQLFIVHFRAFFGHQIKPKPNH